MPQTAPTYANANATPPIPLGPRELVTDDALRMLAQCDVTFEIDQSFLKMYLPDICGELLARRAVMLKDAQADGGAK